MLKILAIDDDDLFLDFLLDWLELHGFQGIEAQKGLLGLQLAKEQVPDLIICDICMPELDGYEVLKKLREDPVTQKIPFIFLSAEQTDNDYQRAMNLGANDYLTKFCMTGRLIQAINTQLKAITSTT